MVFFFPNLCLKEALERGVSFHGRKWAVWLETKLFTLAVSELLYRNLNLLYKNLLNPTF